MFNMPLTERNTIMTKYKAKTPAPLNTQFPDRRSRAEAVVDYNKIKQKETTLYPSGEVISD